MSANPYIPILVIFAIGFGFAAAQKGLSAFETTLMSLTVMAGTSQMVALDIWAQPLPLVALAVSVFVANLRYFVMGAALQPHMPHLPWWLQPPVWYVTVDQNWAVNIAEVEVDPVTGQVRVLGVVAVQGIDWQDHRITRPNLTPAQRVSFAGGAGKEVLGIAPHHGKAGQQHEGVDRDQDQEHPIPWGVDQNILKGQHHEEREAAEDQLDCARDQRVRSRTGC